MLGLFAIRIHGLAPEADDQQKFSTIPVQQNLMTDFCQTGTPTHGSKFIQSKLAEF